jgi:hypothetical protein
MVSVSLSYTQLVAVIEATGYRLAGEMDDLTSHHQRSLRAAHNALIRARNRWDAAGPRCAACGKPVEAHFRRGRRIDCSEVR